MKLLRTLALGLGLGLAASLLPLSPALAAATTTTTLASSAASTAVGTPVTLTATVVAASGTGPAGNVTFKKGTTTLGTVALSGTGDTRTATYVATFTTAATHSLTAVYAGNASNITSTSEALVQTVDKASATASVSASAPSVIQGQSVTFAASVTGYNPSGNVAFMNGATLLATKALGGTGNTRTASYANTTLGVGVHSITVVYAGNTNNTASTSAALTQTIEAKEATTTALLSSANPSTYQQSIELTASVTGTNPSGTVTFKNGTATLGSATLSAGVATLSTSALATGTRSLSAVYAGDASHGASTSAVLTQTVGKVASSISLLSATNPVTVGVPTVLTATVSGYNPTGNVVFKNGTATLGAVALSGTGGTRTASYTATLTGAGAKNLSAVYAGNTYNQPSTSEALVQTVDKASATASVSASAPSVLQGQSVTFTASVTGYNPSGNVAFMDGATLLATKALGGTGNTRTASYAKNTLGVGAHSITVVYAGNANNTASTSPAITQTIEAKEATTTALLSSANPSTYQQSIELTASVTGTNPSGTVTFKNGTATLGSATLSAGVATLSTSALATGTRSLSAVYAGDASHATSTSAVLTQTVGKVASSTSLTTSANPATLGSGVTFTATVAGATPTGTVTFKKGTLTLGTGALSAGVATYTTSTLGAGTYSITAVYAGNANNSPSTSAAVSQGVTPLSATTTSLTANPASTDFGQTVLLSASVTGNNPTGTITFMDGATTLGTGTISAGVATWSVSTLTPGAHSLSAVYAGDANNSPSTSAALSQTVNPGALATTTTLSATPNPATVGQSITLTASVSGGNTPGGTVSFSDGSTPLGTATLSAGVATLTTSALATGGHALVAQYGGDAGNLASASASVQLSVNTAGIGAMTWKYGYDAMGRPTSTIDPNGLATYTYYDSLGRPIQTQQPANAGSSTPTTTDLQYNLADGLTQVTDPRNLATTYTPDGLGNVTSQASPDSGASQYTFDANGNVLSSTDARGKVTTLVYDALNRITSITYTTGTPTTLEYDGGPTPTPAAKGELTRITDESGSTSYSFDALGRLSSKTQTTAGKSFTVGYSWGDAGSAMDKLTGITYPSGNRVNYTYDAQGYRSSISVNPVNLNGVGTSGATQSLLSAITYNADSNITGWNWSNATPRTIAYDSFGQIASYSLGNPTGVGAGAGSQRALVRDAAGRITGYTHTNTAASMASLDQSFGYDNLNRLLSATLASTTTQYAYDANGNRTAKVVGASTYANTVSATSNRLTQTQDAGGSATLQYDAAGHITGDGANTFTYSDRGRMASASNAGGTVSYLYNAAGLRVAKTGPTLLVPSGAAYFVYDEQGQLLGEYDANGTPLYETVYLGMGPVGVLKQTGAAAQNNIATNVYHVHADHLGTARVITRASDNAMVWRWDSAEAFGGSAANQDPSQLGAFTYNPRFPGQVFDAETGLFDNWNRTYDARQGRYRQSDPIGLAGGINTFAYVEGDPLSMVDPTGEFGVVGAVLGGGGELGLQLLLNGGNLKCVDWWAVGVAGASGAIGGAALNGVFKLSKGSMKWENVRRRYRRGHDVPGSQDVHHWGIEKGGAVARQIERFFGREGRDAIVNHPANLQAIDRAVHQGIHNSYGPLGRWWYGTPGWAKAVQGSVGVGAAGEALQDCECSR